MKNVNKIIFVLISMLVIISVIVVVSAKNEKRSQDSMNEKFVQNIVSYMSDDEKEQISEAMQQDPVKVLFERARNIREE